MVLADSSKSLNLMMRFFEGDLLMKELYEIAHAGYAVSMCHSAGSYNNYKLQKPF